MDILCNLVTFRSICQLYRNFKMCWRSLLRFCWININDSVENCNTLRFFRNAAHCWFSSIVSVFLFCPFIPSYMKEYVKRNTWILHLYLSMHPTPHRFHINESYGNPKGNTVTSERCFCIMRQTHYGNTITMSYSGFFLCSYQFSDFCP